ncbi:dienelactone hydrolase family protein [Candidatus Poribacteria bacterium]
MKTIFRIELSFFRILVAGFMLTGLLSTAQGAERVVGEFETPKLKINYLIMLPDDYSRDTGRHWPLFFGLHGAGAKGNNVDLLDSYETSPPDILKIREQFIRVWPQCPAGIRSRWVIPDMLEALDAFLNEILAEYAVDANRIYLFGISMGGEGVWALSMEHPERFAAISPIAGYSYRILEACVLKDVPTWVFHGEKDATITPLGSQAMVDALRDCGGDVKFTFYPDADHSDAIIRAGNTPELYDWFLQHSLQRVPTNIQPGGKLMTIWGEIKY